MNITQYQITSKIQTFPGMGAWYFAVIPKKDTQQISELFHDLKRGFGSLRVLARIGQTTWRTSIFLNTKTKTYFLPIKAQVRKKEGIEKNKVTLVQFEIMQ